ncbi:hypothetical protein [Ferruginibacter albus]|uniref:hypothetical protein n=1 Tax=Ferruginibacter albus TaxID=2875540 RepID=UPI001CC63426|nr:hypothetical protein [Ferruginibacter albus]UAY53235.1 hypothetical protein K9M53_06080 [Ferruginibacter albus]
MGKRILSAVPKKYLSIGFALFCLFCNQRGYSQSQQNIGFSPYMDGGAEGQPITGGAATFLVTPSYYYTVNNSNASVAFNAAGGRSGPKYLTWVSVASSNSNGFYTPSDNASAIQNNTSYVVQFYYKFGGSSGISFRVAASPDGTNFGSNVSTSSLSSTSSWTKVNVVVTSGSTSASSPNGLLRFTPSSTFSTAYAIDDIVMYPGSSVDNSAPDNPSAPTIAAAANNSLSLQWTAASNVDGGGYMVIRYTADPSSSSAPNVNGIYAVGNTIGSGTVAYIGTGTSFTDNGLNSNMQYYYRIYSVDKAFNYGSTPATINTTTTNDGAFKNLTVTNKTLLATLGDGVGIGGVTNPTEKLEVSGNIKATGLVIPTDAALGRVLVSDEHGKATWQERPVGGSSDVWTIATNNVDACNSNTGNTGVGTCSPLAKLHIYGDLLASTNVTSLPNPSDGLTAKSLLWWNPTKESFRVGGISTDAWDVANIGPNSFAAGWNTIAYGENSTSLGAQNAATGYTSFSAGDNNTASGDVSTTFGVHNTASGIISFAMGQETISSGYASLSIGELSNASGDLSFAGGASSSATGTSSFAFGSLAQSMGLASVAIGEHSTASADASFALGIGTTAATFASVALGSNNLGLPGSTTEWVSTDPLLEIGNGDPRGDASNALTILKNGSIGIATSTPNTNTKLDINGNANITGKVAIGSPMKWELLTDNAKNYYLAVNGDAIFQKAKVQLFGEWSDFVFNDNYKLLSISDVEKFIKKNKHLPDVPSAAEVKKDGIDLGSNQAILLQKIEELTLYMIDQNKKIDAQTIRIKELEEKNNQINNLQKEVEELKRAIQLK